MYQINFSTKHAERDNYETGCDPDTSVMYEPNIFIKAENLSELIVKVKELFSVADDSLLFNSCDEVGRLDVQAYEGNDGTTVDLENESERKDWEAGKKEVWLATYTGIVEKTEIVDLSTYAK